MTRREFESAVLNLINRGARKINPSIDYINEDKSMDSYITTDSILSDRDMMSYDKIIFIYEKLIICFGDKFPECFRERLKAAA
ncbi:MAG: hypothetical protein ACYCSQ_00210 [bacterium]